MTIQAGSTIREILKELETFHQLVRRDEEPQIIGTMALVAALGNIEHRLEDISTYLASIEGQLLKR